MKLSELIKELEEFSQEYGDSEVSVISYHDGYFNMDSAHEFESKVLGSYEGTIIVKKD